MIFYLYEIGDKSPTVQKRHNMNKLTIALILLLGINNLTLAAPIQVDIKYLYYRNGWDNYKTLKNGSVLYREKDFLKIIFTPSQRAYVYIFAKGSSGNIYRIFPMQAFKGKIVNNFNPVLAGEDYHIPKKDKAFSLGGSPGKETLYFIVSKQPDVELESRYSQILYARSIKTQANEMVASRAFEEEVLSRDITDIVYDPVSEQKPSAVYEINEAGKQFIVIRDRLLSCDGCVSRVTYELR
jgi:hypothetical protein